MVCRDGLPYLLEALGSVLEQTFTDLELLFWDNGSRDGSREAAALLAESIRVFGSPAPVPLATARNHLTEEAKGRYLAFLDADDLWYPEKLERQLARMEQRGSSWSYTDCRIISGRGDPLGRFGRRSPQRSGRITAALLRENFIPLSTVVVERDAVIEAGGFDSAFSVANDYDLWLRLSTSHPVLPCPEVLGAYRIHGGNLTGRYRTTYRENRLLYRRWASSTELTKDLMDVATEAQALLSLRWGLREIVEGREFARGLKRIRIGLARVRGFRTLLRFAYGAAASAVVRLKMVRERRRSGGGYSSSQR